jgi:hypothetical protein
VAARTSASTRAGRQRSEEHGNLPHCPLRRLTATTVCARCHAAAPGKISPTGDLPPLFSAMQVRSPARRPPDILPSSYVVRTAPAFLLSRHGRCRRPAAATSPVGSTRTLTTPPRDGSTISATRASSITTATRTSPTTSAAAVVHVDARVQCNFCPASTGRKSARDGRRPSSPRACCTRQHYCKSSGCAKIQSPTPLAVTAAAPPPRHAPSSPTASTPAPASSHDAAATAATTPGTCTNAAASNSK